MIPYRSPIDAQTPPVDRLVAVQSVRLRARQSVHTGPIVVVAAIVCGVAFGGLGGGLPSLVWTVGVVIAAIVNRRECQRLVDIPDDLPPAQIARAEERLWWLTVLNTLTVGAGIWLNSMLTDDTRVLYLVTMVMTLYTMGALINASTHPPTFVTGAWINLGSLVLYWAIEGGPEGWAPAFAVAGLLLLVTRFSRQIRTDFERTVRIDRENAELLVRVREEAEVARQARLAAEQANLTKSRFLAAASHDLRQPLYTLQLFSSLLERADDAHRPQFVRHIQSAAGTLDRLFGGLLDLSRLDSGTIGTDPRPVAIDDLVRPVVDELAATAAQKGLVLRMRGTDAMVRTDAFLFERILRNLVDNAIKYTDRGEVEVTVDADDTTVRVAVRDTGIGIAEADRERVFDEFHQLRTMSRDAARGAGLGLAIVRRLCGVLGLRIEVCSTPGAGSTFTLSMARLPDAPTRVTAAAPAPAMPAGIDVLVQSDDEPLRTQVSDALVAWRCRPHVVDRVDALAAMLVQWRGTPPSALIVGARVADGSDGVAEIERARVRWPGLPGAVLADSPPGTPVASGGDVAVLPRAGAVAAIAAWLQASFSGSAASD